MTIEEQIRQEVQTIKEISTLPQVMRKVMEVIMNERSSAQDLAREISCDQALTGKILRIVNSAFYGFYRKISSVEQAVVILGYKEIRSIAITISVFDLFGRKRSRTCLDRMKLWEHAIAVGTLADILRERYQRAEEGAFVAGLLHDIGIMVLDEYFPTQWGPVIEQHQAYPDRPLIELEQDILGITHPDVGYLLAERWNLPQDISDAIRDHHKPISPADTPLKSLVFLSNAIVKKNEIGFSGDASMPELSREDYLSIGMEEAQQEEILKVLSHQMKAMAALLGFLVESR